MNTNRVVEKFDKLMDNVVFAAAVIMSLITLLLFVVVYMVTQPPITELLSKSVYFFMDGTEEEYQQMKEKIRIAYLCETDREYHIENAAKCFDLGVRQSIR